MFITRLFTFDSAHNLTNYYGKCERIHGHTYKLEVTFEGKVQSNGLIVDFVLLKRIVNKHVIDKLDHQMLNEIIENPSAERTVVWIWDQLKDLSSLLEEEINDPNIGDDLKKTLERGDNVFDAGLRLYELVLWESEKSKVTYNGE